MDEFGGVWVDYVEKIEKEWRDTVADEDTVLLCGDTTWGMSLQESIEDFRFIERLPGKKRLIKGNHDYYWTTLNKMHHFLSENEMTSIDFIHNNFAVYEQYALCGTKGWFVDEDRAGGHDQKIYQREVGRLETSLREAKAAGFEKIFAFLHYPPIFREYEYKEITALLNTYGVILCCYGHLHGFALNYAMQGMAGGVDYRCISADFLKFHPCKIL